jgi:putative intracellular protease/amidase
MNILFLAYPQYADFQVGHPLCFLRGKGNARVTTVTVDGQPVDSLGGLRVRADFAISDIHVEDYDLLLISGGEGVSTVMDNLALHSLLQSAHRAKVPIAALCASSVFLAKAGLLLGRSFTCTLNTYTQFCDAFSGAAYTGTRVESHDGLLTAEGHAVADFTVEIGRMVGLWRSEEEAAWASQFCRGEV